MNDYTNEQVEALCWKIEQLQSDNTLLNGRIIKQRGEILQLKSYIGHQNLHINNIEQNKQETIEINYEEADRD
jgi:hypothetical protein